MPFWTIPIKSSDMAWRRRQKRPTTPQHFFLVAPPICRLGSSHGPDPAQLSSSSQLRRQGSGQKNAEDLWWQCAACGTLHARQSSVRFGLAIRYYCAVATTTAPAFVPVTINWQAEKLETICYKIDLCPNHCVR